MTGVRDRWPTVSVRYRQGQHIFLYLRESTIARGVSSLLRSGYRGPFARGKSVGREADRLQTIRAAVKNELFSSPQYEVFYR